MPVTPTELADLMFGSAVVNSTIKYIDDRLRSNEEFYRHGVHGDYYYHINCVGVLSPHEQDAVAHAYRNAGWPAVQVRLSISDPGKTTVRLYFSSHSAYFAHDAKQPA